MVLYGNYKPQTVNYKLQMKYFHEQIEAKWQKYWAENQTFAAENNSEKPKHYVLDMFPYPSGAGLHVGHPLGYIASDVYSRFKRHQGFNVLHPMGYDSFGLPAEQYAIQTGQRPEDTTRVNIDGGVDKEGKVIDISELVNVFEKEGNAAVEVVCDDNVVIFTAEEWNSYSDEQKQKIL